MFQLFHTLSGYNRSFDECLLQFLTPLVVYTAHPHTGRLNFYFCYFYYFYFYYLLPYYKTSDKLSSDTVQYKQEKKRFKRELE